MHDHSSKTISFSEPGPRVHKSNNQGAIFFFLVISDNTVKVAINREFLKITAFV